ncbi:MAG: hypothetical protein GX134_04195 [candidate division WS1 bacterium]|jgi:hypothetical protein|nr:hypothetical protein [candidate division WS1 bacterium]
MKLLGMSPYLALPMVLASSAVAQGISAQEIAELAATLPAEPAVSGAPISNRQAWEDLAARTNFASVIAQAEALAQEPLPETTDALYLEFFETGNRTHWQAVASQRRGRVSTFALAECLEGQGRFIAPLREAIHSICSEATWVMPAHDSNRVNIEGQRIDIDLGSSALGWNMATACALLGDRLDEETQTLVRGRIRERILDPFLAMIRGEREANWWLVGTNNWNHVCLAGVVGAALAVAEAPEERAEFILAGARYAGFGLRGFTPDGYCSEGVGYWNYGFGHFASLAEMIQQATGGQIDLFARADVLAPALYGARMEIADGVYPSFADCAVTAKPDARLMSFLSHKYGLGLADYPPELMVGPGGGVAEAVLYSFPVSQPIEVGDEVRQALASTGATWFENAGILISRPESGQSSSRLGIAAKGGNNAEHHNHNDVGSYVVVTSGRAVLLDPGAEIYTARTFSGQRYESKLLNSYGHPVPVIAGELQMTGAQSHGEVIDAVFAPDEDRLSIEMSSCYDVDELQSLQRTFSHQRTGHGVFTVTDAVRFSSPQTYETALITRGDVERVAANVLHVYDTDVALRVEIETSGPGFSLSEDRIEEDAPVQPLRIGVTLNEPVTQATVTLRIEPLELPADDALLPNGDFSHGGFFWSVPRDGLASISTERAYLGERSLHITDDSDSRGTNVESGRLALTAGSRYTLSGQVFHIGGQGIGMYVRFYGSDGRTLNEVDGRGNTPPLGTLEGAPGEWAPFEFTFEPPNGTVEARVWIHSYNAAVVEAFVDALEVRELAD